MTYQHINIEIRRPAPALSRDPSPEKTLPEPLSPELTSILVQHRGEFLRYLQRRLGSRDDAEDVLQDFHMRVVVKAGQIRETGSTVAWLRTVLKSVLVDHFRRKAAERHAHHLMVADWRATIAEPAMTSAEEENFEHATCTCFYRLLPELKAEYADALSRVDLGQESREEAARALGVTAGNMRVRLHRARRALKRALERSCDQCRTNGCFHG